MAAPPPRAEADRMTSFQEKKGHCLTYGLKIVERDSTNAMAIRVHCRFCNQFGRESKPGAKRKAKSGVQIFKPPYRTDEYTKHLNRCHPQKWAEYRMLSSAEKAGFFSEKRLLNLSGFSAQFESGKRRKILFSKHLIDELISDLLFDERDQVFKQRSLAFFRPVTARMVSGQEFDNVSSDLVQILANNEAFKPESVFGYTVEIAFSPKFRLIVKFLQSGASFRAAAKYAQAALEVMKDSTLEECSIYFAMYVARTCCAISLLNVQKALNKSFAFSIGLGCCNEGAQRFLDVRLRVYSEEKEDICNFHVLAVTLHGGETPGLLFRKISKLLDFLEIKWKEKILAVSCEEGSIMNKQLNGLQKLLEEQAKFPLIKVWSGLQQLDLAAQKVFKNLTEENISSGLDASLLSLIGDVRVKLRSQFPNNLSTIRRSDISRLLSEQLPRLIVAGYDPSIVQTIVEEQHELMKLVGDFTEVFGEDLDKLGEEDNFRDSWETCGGKFKNLKMFCGGLGTTYLNQSKVGNYSSLNGSDTDELTKLSSFSLSAVLHAQQCKKFNWLK